MEHFSWFTLIDMIEYDHILGAILVLLLLVAIGIILKGKLTDDSAVVPDSKISLSNFFQVIGLDFLFDIFENIFGSKEKARKYFPLLGGSFFFILFLNLLGMVPGFLPPTGSLNTTLAFGILIFVLYNYYGFKEHGTGYLKHFIEPFIFMIIFEVVSHSVRPISLSLRLFMNITGDHMVLGVFTNFTHLIMPAVFLGFGVFVSFLQAFIFTVLSATYIALAEAYTH